MQVKIRKQLETLKKIANKFPVSSTASCEALKLFALLRSGINEGEVIDNGLGKLLSTSHCAVFTSRFFFAENRNRFIMSELRKT